MTAAKEVAKLGEPKDLLVPLDELIKNKYPQLKASDDGDRSDGMKRITSPL